MPDSVSQFTNPARRPPGLAGALLATAVAAAVVLSPGHPERFRATWSQLRTLPVRVRESVGSMHLALKGRDYAVVAAIASNTPPDAVILISDDPRDGRLASAAWLAYYLYPRVLVTPKMLAAAPGTSVDFALLTPNFPPNLPDSLRPPGPVLEPLRGERFRRGLWERSR